jgi:hypothetical protein
MVCSLAAAPPALYLFAVTAMIERDPTVFALFDFVVMKKPGFTLQSAKVPAPEGAAAVYADAELSGHAPVQPVVTAPVVPALPSFGAPNLVVAQMHVPPATIALLPEVVVAQSGVQSARASDPAAEVPAKGHAVAVSVLDESTALPPAQYLPAGHCVMVPKVAPPVLIADR